MNLYNKHRIIPIFLTCVGCAGMAADLLNFPILKGLMTAWGASIQPKVFSSVEGLETFSSKISVKIFKRDGSVLKTPLTKNLAEKLQGPYNRRNVYGAILVYGPVFQNHPRIGPMMEAIISKIATEGSSLLQDFELSAQEISAIEVELIPKNPSACPHLIMKRRVDFQENF